MCSSLHSCALLGESTAGRPHVAHWENIAAPRLELGYPLHARVEARLGATWLLAPEPELLSRGVLLQARITGRLPRGLSSHLLLEWLDLSLPGIPSAR